MMPSRTRKGHSPKPGERTISAVKKAAESEGRSELIKAIEKHERKPKKNFRLRKAERLQNSAPFSVERTAGGDYFIGTTHQYPKETDTATMDRFVKKMERVQREIAKNPADFVILMETPERMIRKTVDGHAIGRIAKIHGIPIVPCFPHVFSEPVIRLLKSREKAELLIADTVHVDIENARKAGNEVNRAIELAVENQSKLLNAFGLTEETLKKPMQRLLSMKPLERSRLRTELFDASNKMGEQIIASLLERLQDKKVIFFVGQGHVVAAQRAHKRVRKPKQNSK